MSTPHGQGGQPGDGQDPRPWSAPEPEADEADSGATTVFRPQDHLPPSSPSGSSSGTDQPGSGGAACGRRRDASWRVRGADTAG